ncbi:uncharacterized protein [Ambystoma mexicanum]|uniref:uncharacterized protein n=1 Tax=Ambystoma mexicanum TaxID=8296 RepID=UPI0037E95BED
MQRTSGCTQLSLRQLPLCYCSMKQTGLQEVANTMAGRGASSVQHGVSKAKFNPSRQLPVIPDGSSVALRGKARPNAASHPVAVDMPRRRREPSDGCGDTAPWPPRNTVSKEHNYCSQHGSWQPLMTTLCFQKRPTTRALKHSFLRKEGATGSQEASSQEAALHHKRLSKGNKETRQAHTKSSRLKRKRPRREKACEEAGQRIHGLPLEDYRRLFCTLVEQALSPRASPRSGLLQARRVKERLYQAVGCPQYWEVVHPGGQVEVIEGFGQAKPGLAPPHFHIDTGVGVAPSSGEPLRKKQTVP